MSYSLYEQKIQHGNIIQKHLCLKQNCMFRMEKEILKTKVHACFVHCESYTCHTGNLKLM